MSSWRAATADLVRRFAWPALALLGPALLTVLLVAAGIGTTRDYIFLYLGIVAVLGLASGLAPALLSAACSFFLVDFFFVRPVHTLQFADTTDLINLAIFACTAIGVGTFGSRRRAALVRAERLADELRAANVELARLDETERQVRALEETERMRREVLANVSHELRTPMSSILTGTTTLLRRRSLPDDVRPEVESLANEARRLGRLVSDLLDMTRIDRGIIDLRPSEVDIVEAVDASIARLHRVHTERVVTVDAPAHIDEVTADWQRLAQVLDNLLDNADRLSPASEPIHVALSQHDGSVTVRVVDHGPGVADDIRDHVFERFFRGASSPQGDGGMGLGLPIVRGLIEAQGGRVWLEQRAARSGATFAFSLPVAEEEPVTQ